jgi:putative ubiquitin-RnfH superfamily antitoxin RatB of RatAB toxin-antitoxin module
MGAVELLTVELAYGARCQRLTVPYGTSVRGVIERARLLEQHPEIDLAVNRVGIYATLVALETLVASGDRVEVYRPLTIDPKEMRRRRSRG